MDIFLALLRTLVFVVATVVATVYVGRRISRGHALLWAGTTMLVTHWLIQFGWTTYAAGSAEAAPEPTGWLSWVGHLLPFLAAVALIWGIGQAAGASRQARAAGAAARADGGAAGAGMSAGDTSPGGFSAGGAQGGPSAAGLHGGVSGEAASGWADPTRTGHQLPPATASAPVPAAPGGVGGGPAVAPRVDPATRTAPPGARTPTRSRPKPARPPGLIVPHAVPVVMTPSASHHSPPDPDPVVDLGPDPDEPTVATAVPAPGPPPSAPARWAPAHPRPVGPTTPSAEASPSETPEPRGNN